MQPLLSILRAHCLCRGLLLHWLHSMTHTYTYIHTHGRTPLDERSAHRIDLYITHNPHKKQTSILSSYLSQSKYVLWCSLQFTLYFRFCIQICLFLFSCSYVIIFYHSTCWMLGFVQVHEIERCSYSSATPADLPLYKRLKVIIDGQDSTVGISSSRGSKPAEGVVRDFMFWHPSRPAVGSTQPPVQWIRGSFPGAKRPGRGVDQRPSRSDAITHE